MIGSISISAGEGAVVRLFGDSANIDDLGTAAKPGGKHGSSAATPRGRECGSTCLARRAGGRQTVDRERSQGQRRRDIEPNALVASGSGQNSSLAIGSPRLAGN
jgi:hypothetical protein